MSVQIENRRVAMGRNVLISMLGIVAILLMINYLGARQYRRWDWTASRIFSLSERTGALLSGLEQDVSLYVLWSASDPLFGQLRELLEGYRALSGRLMVEMVDPDRNPDQFMMIQNRYGNVRVNEMGQTGFEAGVFVVSGDDVRFLPAGDFQKLRMEETGGDDPVLDFLAESQITSAIFNVTSGQRQTLCFTQGHGEWPLESPDRLSLRHIRRELTLAGLESRAVSTLEEDRIPRDCAAVVVVGPKKAFMPEETRRLRRYYEGGGRLLLLLDPIIEGERFMPTGLEVFLSDNGIGLRSDIVLETDPRRLLSDGNPTTFLADRFFQHPSVRPLFSSGSEVMPVLFGLSRSLEALAQDAVIADALIHSSPMSFGEVDLSGFFGHGPPPSQDELDTEGPLILAMSAIRGTTDGGSDGRMVVVGNSFFLSEELFINASLHNANLWSSLVGWLTERRDLMSVAPRNPEQIHLMLTERDLRSLRITLMLEVLLVALLGAVVIYRRRK